MENHENGTTGPSLSLLKNGAVFPSKTSLVSAVYRLNFAQGRDFRLIQNKDGYYKINCCAAPPSKFLGIEGVCQFLVYAKAEKIDGTATGNWVVYKLVGSHTCKSDDCKRKAHDKRTITSLSTSIRDYVPNKKTRGGSIKQVIDLARMSAGIEMKRSQAAAIVAEKRDDSIEKHIGQFFLLPSYVEALQSADSTGTFVLDKSICAWDHSKYQFNRLYISFSFARKVWRESSFKFFVADGTFSTGIFKQTILLNVVMDGNGNLFLLAYAIVSKENEENWTWFLSKIVADFPGARLFMSDYDKGVQSNRFQALLASNGIYFARCVKHMIDNCQDALGKTKLGAPTERAIYALVRARTRESYVECYEVLKRLNTGAAYWFDGRKNMFATYIFAETGRYRYGKISNNFAEQFNKVIKEWKTLPILSFCVRLNEYCCDNFFKSSSQAKEWIAAGQELTGKFQEEHYTAVDVAAQRHFTQRPSTPPVYLGQVQHTRTGGPTTAVDVEVNTHTCETKCNCKWSEEMRRPCFHVLSPIMKLRLQKHGEDGPRLSVWYDPIFHCSSYASAYDQELPKLGLMGKLKVSPLSIVLPPESQKQKGRPRLNRYKKQAMPKARCLACGQLGHNQTTCAQPVTKIRVENYYTQAMTFAKKAAADISSLD